MNKALYTLLVAALSVGITLAIMKGCSEKCACDDSDAGRNDSAETMIHNSDPEDDENDVASGGSVERSSGQQSSGAANGDGTGSGTPEHRLQKYGDAETGGNVYTKGGYTPERPPGTKLVKPGDSLQSTKGGTSNPLKTASDGQRNR